MCINTSIFIHIKYLIYSDKTQKLTGGHFTQDWNIR